MRKVTKILLRVLSAIILLLIIFPLLPALMLSIPSVQNVVVDRAAKFASDYLGTKVAVGHITVGMLNRVAVRDFYVADLDGDTLLYVKRADAYIASLASLAKKNLVINYGKVQGGKFVVRETERGTFAVKEITDKLSNGERQGGFRLDVQSLDGSGIDFSLYRKDKPRNSGVDYADMHFLGIETHLDNFLVDNGAVSGDIQSLSFVERSGFVLENLLGYFYVYNGKVNVSQARIKSTATDINLDYFYLDGDGWLDYRDFINDVKISCEVSDSSVSSEDVGYFAPAIWSWKTVLCDVSASMFGMVADFKGRIANATLEDGGVLQGSGRVCGLVDVDRTRFDIEVNKLKASTEEVSYLLHNIAHLSIGERAAQYIARVKGVDASGEFHGTIRHFKARAKSALASGGNVSMECIMKNPARGRKAVDAKLFTTDVNLANLLAVEKLSTTTLSTEVQVEFGNNLPIFLRSNSEVANVGFNGYDYENLSLVADMKNDRIDAWLGVEDDALSVRLTADVDISDKSRKECEITMIVNRADLHAMNINRRDSISLLKGRVGLDVSGPSLDMMSGTLQIAEAEYETMGRKCNADLIDVKMWSADDFRKVVLKSDFADAEFNSPITCKYSDIAYSLKHLLAQYIPQWYDDATRQSVSNRVADMGKGLTTLSMTTRKIDPLLNCIREGVEVAEDSYVSLLVNPNDRRLRIDVTSPYMVYRNNLVMDVVARVGNSSDSLTVSLGAKELYAGVFHFSGVDMNGGVKGDVVEMDAMFADSIRDIRGEVSTSMRVSRKNGVRNLSLKLNPTYLYSNQNKWHVTTDGVEANSSRVDIRRFAVRSSDTQELLINGIVSRSDQDSVQMTLRNFSLSPITNITRRIGYNVDGRANGYATVYSAMGNMRIDAHVDMDSLAVSGVGVPDLSLISRWDLGQNRAKLEVFTRQGENDTDKERVAEGYYIPSQKRYYAKLRTEGVQLSLLDPLLTTIITDTEGSAAVDLTLSGAGRMAELRGKIEVDSLATTIDYTKCRYRAPRAIIDVQNNRLTAADVPIFDRNGKKGALSLDVSLMHLSNIEYNFGLNINDMEVLNTTERDNPMFYGTIFASGGGTIKGDKAGVKMDFSARSGDNSKFIVPLTSNSDIATANFVTFATKSVRDTTSYIARKKLMFENNQKYGSSSTTAMELTMNLDVRPNAEVQLVIDPTVGDIIKGTGSGVLNVKVDTLADIFQIYGDYTIEKGSYLFTLQNVVNKWFDIEPGSTIQWTGDPLDAHLNIDAVYKTRASLGPLLEGTLSESNSSSRSVPVECIIHLTDKMMQPTVKFDIEVPSADSDVKNIIASTLATPESTSQQFLFLVATNSFFSESANAMNPSVGVAATAATGMEMISNQLSNWLMNDSSNSKIVLRYRPRSEQHGDEVDFGFSRGFMNDRLQVVMEGNYIADKSQLVNANSNFAGEAYVTWLIDRAGTFRVKGFTHRIDRFDENQGLQEKQ